MSPNSANRSAFRSGFGDAPAGEWNAPQTIAHVALNDYAMTAVAHALIHGRSPRFENIDCQRVDVLDAFAGRFDDLDGLVAEGRRAARISGGAFSRLDPDQRQTLVHCRLEHDGQVVMDQPMPWESIAVSAQAGRHLPAHIEQLRNLRT